MDPLLIEVLSSVPIAVAILIAWIYMDRNRSIAEAEREKNRSFEAIQANDRMKELTTLQSDSFANERMTSQANGKRMEEFTAAIRGMTATVALMNENSLERYEEILATLVPVKEQIAVVHGEVTTTRDILLKLASGQEAILEAMRLLTEGQGVADENIVEQIKALGGLVIAMNKTVSKLRSDLETKRG